MNPVEEFLLVKEAQETKEAAPGDFIRALGNAFRGPEGSAAGALGHAFGQALPGAVITAGMGAAAYGVGRGIGALREHFGKQRDYKAMLEANPSLKQRPARQVQMVYNSLRKMAPSMAADPIIASSFVDNQLDLSNNRAVVGPQTAKTLADTQRSVAQGKGQNMLMQMFQPGYFPKHEEGPDYSVSAQHGLSARGLDRARAEEMMTGLDIPLSGVPTKTRQFGPMMVTRTTDDGKRYQEVRRDASGAPVLEETGFSERVPSDY